MDDGDVARMLDHKRELEGAKWDLFILSEHEKTSRMLKKLTLVNQ